MNDIIRHIKNQLTQTVRNSLLKIDLAGTDSEEFKKALESEIEIESCSYFSRELWDKEKENYEADELLK